MIFRSAVDWWLYVVIAGTAVLVLFSLWPAFQSGNTASIVIGLAAVLLALGLPVWLLVSTYYSVDGSQLTIRTGPLRWSVPIEEIESIEPSRSMLSSPALSLDRLRITYSNGKQLLVSPKDRDAFVKALEHVL